MQTSDTLLSLSLNDSNSISISMMAADTLRTPPRLLSSRTAAAENSMAPLEAPSSASSTHQQQHMRTAASAMVHALFGNSFTGNNNLAAQQQEPSLGPCWGDFDCTHAHIRGRLYAVTTGILFYSNLLGFERRLCLQFADIRSMALYRTTSLRIELWDETNYVFKSFKDRTQVLQLLIGLKRLADEKIKKQQNGNKPLVASRTQSEGVMSAHSSSSHNNSMNSLNDNNNNREQTPWTPTDETTTALMMDNLPVSSTPNHSLRRSATSAADFHVASSSASSVVSSAATAPPNRRRAVSDSLVRFLGLDDEPEHSIIHPTSASPSSRDELLDSLDLDLLPHHRNNFDNATTTKNVGDPIQTAWERVVAEEATALEEVGIESLRLACSLDSFQRNFLADDAPFSFDRFQREHIHDRDLTVTRWQPLRDEAPHPNRKESALTAAAAAATDPTTQQKQQQRQQNRSRNSSSSSNDTAETVKMSVRTLTFTHPIKRGSMGMGPTEAHTKRRQVWKRYGAHGMTFENTTEVEGIPSADCFSVHDFWKIAADGPNHVRVSVRFAPRFTKRTILRGMIEKNIRKETKTWFAEYSKMVHAALEAENGMDESEPGSTVAGKESLAVEDDQVGLSVGAVLQTWLRSVYPLVLLGMALLLVTVAVLVLQLLQSRDAMSLMRDEMVALRQTNQQFQQEMIALRQTNQYFQQEMVALRQDNQQTLQLLSSQQQQISSSLNFVGESVVVKSRGAAWDPDEKILTLHDSSHSHH